MLHRHPQTRVFNIQSACQESSIPAGRQTWGRFCIRRSKVRRGHGRNISAVTASPGGQGVRTRSWESLKPVVKGREGREGQLPPQRAPAGRSQEGTGEPQAHIGREGKRGAPKVGGGFLGLTLPGQAPGSLPRPWRQRCARRVTTGQQQKRRRPRRLPHRRPSRDSPRE